MLLVLFRFLLIYWVLITGCSSTQCMHGFPSIHPSASTALPGFWRLSQLSYSNKKPSVHYLKWLLMSGICLYTTLLTSHHTISVTLRSGLKVFACVLALLSCCMTCFHQGLTFDSRKWWDTEEFMVNSVTSRCPGPVANASIRVWVCV